jgi:RNA polymerase-binding transcription factor DksA
VELDIRMVERHSEFITLIDEALQRLRQSPGDFDVSVVSGARIPFERLEMVPWTRRLTEEVGHD